MNDPRSTARKAVEHLVAGWLTGDHAAVRGVCLPGVRWWSPLDDTSQGADVCTVLDGVLATVHGRIDVAALLVSDDGSRSVVEMRTDAANGRPSSFVTSVLTLSDGRVAAGRTYVDLPGLATSDGARP